MISLHTDAVKEIRLHHKRGAQVHELADAYGVSRQAVWKIVTRRTHKRVLDLPDGTDLPNLRRLLHRLRASTAAGARPTPPAKPPADPPPPPVAPPRPTPADREAAAQAQEVQRREDAARKQAEKLEKARLLTDQRQCTGPRCAVLYHCKCHEATSVDDRIAASASCAGEFCHCFCHSGEMPAIVHAEDVPDFMLSS